MCLLLGRLKLRFQLSTSKRGTKFPEGPWQALWDTSEASSTMLLFKIKVSLGFYSVHLVKTYSLRVPRTLVLSNAPLIMSSYESISSLSLEHPKVSTLLSLFIISHSSFKFYLRVCFLQEAFLEFNSTCFWGWGGNHSLIILCAGAYCCLYCLILAWLLSIFPLKSVFSDIRICVFPVYIYQCAEHTIIHLVNLFWVLTYLHFANEEIEA